jgi:hypothetical protein
MLIVEQPRAQAIKTWWKKFCTLRAAIPDNETRQS